MNELFALADCNNFYVSCERVFNRSLLGRPVAVLSNNDGCVIALSEEAKKSGVKRGTPIFQCRAVLEKIGGTVLSSNYALYGDISSRVMKTMGELVPAIEIYSIDEAFLILTGVKDPESRARFIRERVLLWTAVPVSIGIGATKTLAKAANRYAKKHPACEGVFTITPDNRVPALGSIAVEDVWGVGYAYKRMLNTHGVFTALDFSKLDPKFVRQRMTVCGERTLRELNGEPCIEMETSPKQRKTVVSSRSFGTPVITLQEMTEAVSSYASTGAAKMRRQGLLASALTVFIATNYFRESDAQYTGSLSMTLADPTSSPQILARESITLLKKIYRDGYRYKKAGIMLYGLVREDEAQYSLFTDRAPTERRDRIARVIDETNARFGGGSIQTASSGFSRNWQMRRSFMSPRWTTSWEEIPAAK